MTIARSLGGRNVAAIGLGCMNLSHAYGTPPSADQGAKLLLRALDLGVDHFDTATLYGFGANEELVGATLSPYRQRFFLASKCGIGAVDGVRVIDGRPETLKRACLESLRRLRTDVIDLYYLHRWDKKIPIEDSVGALADMVKAGHLRSIGLSEVSPATIRKAHAVHPIAAVQNEYSLWTRNPEGGVLETCRAIGATLVAFSPLGRGFLAGSARTADELQPKDLRRGMPRFQEPNFLHNLELLTRYRELASQASCTPAQLALAWLLQKAPHVVPIPGTTSIAHLEENLAASKVQLDRSLVGQLESLINDATVHGNRYPPQTLQEIDS